MSHPPEPCIVHPLPAAPQFFGREPLLAELRQLWSCDVAGVVALIGLGGAGKTALAARFLDELARSDVICDAPGGRFIWSFYREPDAGHFLRSALWYFSGSSQQTATARGMGIVHLLAEALSDGRRHLLVLDGLERVQLTGERNPADFGHLEDPLLKSLLTRAATGIGRSLIILTSRFPLTDLERAGATAYQAISLGGLEAEAAVNLLRSSGVQGDDLTLRTLADKYGDHALTLDHLGKVIGEFFEGDVTRVPNSPALDTVPGETQAVRLSRLLRQYEAHLPRHELDLLMHLGLFVAGSAKIS